MKTFVFQKSFLEKHLDRKAETCSVDSNLFILLSMGWVGVTNGGFVQ